MDGLPENREESGHNAARRASDALQMERHVAPVTPAAAPPPAPAPPPRVWTALLAFPIAFVLFLGAQVLVIAMSMVLVFGGMPEMSDLMSSPVFLVAIAAGQITILLAAVVAAVLSPEPFADRLALRRPRCSWLLVVPMAVGTLFLGSLAMMILPLIFEQPPEALQAITELVLGAEGLLALALLGTIGIMPGIAEELLYRGYIQQRLTVRWGGLAGILIANTFFALHHVDPGHVAAVFVLGLWLGFITWKTGSIWPAVICHAANNTFGIVLVLFAPELFVAPEGEWGGLGIPAIPFMAVTGAGLLYAIIVLLRTNPKPP